MLKDAGIGMDAKNFTPDQLSQAAKLMASARKVTDEKYQELLKNLNNIIIDGTAGASNPIRKKKEQLEALMFDPASHVPVLISWLKRAFQFIPLAFFDLLPCTYENNMDFLFGVSAPDIKHCVQPIRHG